MLENMEKYSHNSFKPNNTLKQIRIRFLQGHIPKRRQKIEQLSVFDNEGE